MPASPSVQRHAHGAASTQAAVREAELLPPPSPLQTNEIRNGRLAMIACLGCFGQAVMTAEGPFKNLADHLVRGAGACRCACRQNAGLLLLAGGGPLPRVGTAAVLSGRCFCCSSTPAG